MAPHHVLPSAIAVHHKRHSVDKSTRTSSTQHTEAHIGVPNALMEQDNRYRHLLTNSCPFTAQSVVTTTTTITTTVTTNTSAHPGDTAHGFQPWFSTNRRTDVAESTTVTHQSELIAAGNPNSMQIEQAYLIVDDLAQLPRRTGRRRSFDDTNAANLTAAANVPGTERAPIRGRRTSTPAAVNPTQGPKFTITATISPLPSQNHETPLTFLRLSHAPKSSDLIIMRLVAPANAEFEASGEFLTAIVPKHSTTATGEILVAPFSLPSYLSHINLEDCRLSFSWLSGERVQAALVSDPLSPTPASALPPLLKRPKLEEFN